MEDRFEVIVFQREPNLGEILLMQSGEQGIRVRQLGEQLQLPPDATIIDSYGFMPRHRIDRWLAQREGRGELDYAHYVRSQVSRQEWKILQTLGVNLDTTILADLWPDFVDFDKRRQREAPFLLEHLAEYDNPRVLDACLGAGATSIGLLLSGVDVVSNEIDWDLVEQAHNEAKKHRVDLRMMHEDWKDLHKNHMTWHAVLCLGNSLTYLFKRKDQLKVLRNFRTILEPKGKLIIDERNYAEHLLGGRYRFSGDVVYCGNERVSAHPLFVSDNMVVMEYEHREKGRKAHLVLYPFKRGEFRGLLEAAGFRDIVAFGDYKKEFKQVDPEFITYVCRK